MGTETIVRALEKLGWGAIARPGELLQGYTSFGVGGPAELLVLPEDVEQTTEVVKLCRREKVTVRALGAGTNLLVSDTGVDGVVVCTRRLRAQQFHGRIITVGAGTPLPLLVRWAMRQGLSGLEPLVGIPGTVGAAVVMNAGGKYGAISAAVRSVTIVDEAGRKAVVPVGKIPFGYRSSGLEDVVVLDCTLELTASTPAAVARRTAEILREKKTAQPLSGRSAGCFFRNPPAGPAAGWLIEHAGLKGSRVGGAHVSIKHSNFIMAEKGATARDIHDLAATVVSEVKTRHGVSLEFEVKVWR